MKILLDIDGVMVSGASWRQIEILNDGFPDFMRSAVQNLQRIVSATNASIVLTTSHRSRFNILEWESIFKSRGLNVPITILPDNPNKIDAILDWVVHDGKEPFVVIDDDRSLNVLPKSIKDRCVFPDSIIGLCAYSTEKSIQILLDGSEKRI